LLNKLLQGRSCALTGASRSYSGACIRQNMKKEKENIYEKLIDFSKLSRGLLLKGLLPYYVLGLLAREKMYGKKIIDRIYQVTGGNWRPSPGSVYPLLKKMTRLGLVSEHVDDSSGIPKRVYELKDAGREVYKDMRDEIKPRLKRTIELLTLHLEELDRDL
jgi:DNA-binding PadR family transcriptional regulator